MRIDNSRTLLLVGKWLRSNKEKKSMEPHGLHLDRLVLQAQEVQVPVQVSILLDQPQVLHSQVGRST